MVHDKISLALQDLAKLKENLRDIKKDIKAEEKINNDQYLELKRALKELKGQVKDFEESYLADLKSSEHYNKLRELRLKAEEELANANERLFKQVAQLPPKPFDMQVEMGDYPVKVSILPDMRVFVNGKEEKRRII